MVDLTFRPLRRSRSSPIHKIKKGKFMKYLYLIALLLTFFWLATVPIYSNTTVSLQTAFIILFISLLVISFIFLKNKILKEIKIKFLEAIISLILCIISFFLFPFPYSLPIVIISLAFLLYIIFYKFKFKSRLFLSFFIVGFIGTLQGIFIPIYAALFSRIHSLNFLNPVIIFFMKLL